ncbi:MAG: hypothetical protein ABIG44_03075 [Planctomycetota bacterium]
MIPADRLYNWLTELSSPDAERIMAAALARAEQPYLDRIVHQLLDRGTDAAWAALVANYDRLDPEFRQQLRCAPDRLRVGLAAALAAPHDPRARGNALWALTDNPYPTLSYLLPDALRDASGDVRKAATRALRCIAQMVIEPPTLDNPILADQDLLATGRAEVVKAVWEALRTFDLHYCREVIEISLWFARDFGDQLWEFLGNRRSECGNIASHNLSAWSGPYLARFLLEGLKRQGWRGPARQILLGWNTSAHFAAILRNTDLLTDREICRSLASFKNPVWLSEVDRNLSSLPVDVRHLAPHWVARLGLDMDLKIQVLSEWLRSESLAVGRSCVYALATLDTPEVIPHLEKIATGNSPLAVFTRWWISGQRDGPLPAVSTPPADTNFSLPPAHDFDRLWKTCRRRITAEDSRMLDLLRANLGKWLAEVSARLTSSDPHDRLLGLRIIYGTDHVGEFPSQLATLVNDPVDSVRHLARAVVKAASSAESDPISPEDSPSLPLEQQLAVEDVQRNVLRHKVREALASLSAVAGESEDMDQCIQEVRLLLRQIAMVDSSGDQPTTTETEASS